MAGGTITEHRVFGLKLLPQVLIGLVLGVAIGFALNHQIVGYKAAFEAATVSGDSVTAAADKAQYESFKNYAEDIKVLGTIFLNLIKMLVIPLIFLALVSGISNMKDPKNFTRVGVKGILAYVTTSMVAVLLGIGAGILFQPGSGLHIDLASLASTPVPAGAASPPSIGQFFIDLIPTNIIKAMSEDRFLQVIVFAIFFGTTMMLLGEKVERARMIILELAAIVFKMIEYIVRLAPLAVLGYMAWSVGTQGLAIIGTLAKLVAAVIAACGVQYLGFGLLILVVARISPLPFYRKMATTQMMAFSTSSSKATLTTAMSELENKLGVSANTANFMMPLGACINMDGTAIYLGICAMFFSQLFGHPLSGHDYGVLILTATLGSIGAAGIPSGSIIFMGMVLSSVGLPIEGIGLILGVDRMLDMVRTMINITGDSAITLVIDKTEGTLDEVQYRASV